MSQDDGMDGTDWRARALKAEHSVGVLTAQLEAERAKASEVETVWDRDARAVVAALIRRIPHNRDISICDVLDEMDWIVSAMAEKRDG